MLKLQTLSTEVEGGKVFLEYLVVNLVTIAVTGILLAVGSAGFASLLEKFKKTKK